MYVDVLIMGTPSNFDQIFTYRIPPELKVEVGSLVSVPVRQRNYKGLALTIFQDKPNLRGLRNIKQVLVREPVVTGCGFKLAHWLADYYVCSLNKALQLFIPPPVRMKEKIVYFAETSFPARELLLQEKEKKILKVLRANLGQGLTSREIRQKLQQPVQKELAYLIENKFIRFEKVFVPQVTHKEKVVFRIKEGCEDVEKVLSRAPRQREILKLLKEAPHSRDDLKAKGTYSRTALQGLYEKNLIEVCKQKVERSPLQEKLQSARPEVLNLDQKRVCEIISNNLQTEAGKKKWLLFGITGSGKTEVYLRVMKEILAQGKQVLYLVPEISLTPQIVSLLAEVFGEEVVVLHSALSAGERYDQWMKIREGRAKVVLGPRSAVFAPFTDLGLIIIDEEHENTYKQNEPDPRYAARRVAEKLAELLGAILIMGSATPSLRSFYLAKKGRYGLLKLPQRVAARPLPQIEIIDLKKELRVGNRSIFSRKLLESLRSVITAGEQALLFMNRRGFHTYVMCRECGKPLTCPHCSITLIYHRSKGRLVCHYCHFQRSLPKSCSFCGSSYVRYYGTGTERVATEFARLFPGVPFLRMDTDTTQQKDSHMRMVKEFQEGKAQVLIGTQMIAKGLDFPEVTLVGVVNPDFFLNMPDYQAGERAYQLMTQVAGRAGRGEKAGKVLIQTYDPEHYLFSAVVRQDYEEFYGQEIANREVLQYPPFLYLARIMVSGYNERQVRQRIQSWQAFLENECLKLKEKVEFLGSGPAPIGFLKKRFRYHLIIKSKQLKVLQYLTRQVREKDLKNSGEPRTIIDIEPQNLL